MESITLAIPAPLKHFVDRQAAGAGFDSSEDYILFLLQELQHNQAEDRQEMEDFLRRSREDIDAGRTRPMLEAVESLGKTP